MSKSVHEGVQDMETKYEMTIRPPHEGWASGLNLKEVWRYRELAIVFAIRDLKVRYRQTMVGVAWAFIQPVTTIVLFNFVFGNLAKIPSEGVPYALFSFIGVNLWGYFSNSLTNASNAVIGNEGIIKKIYFPRLILPLSSAITPLADMAIAYLIFIGMMIFLNFMPNIWGFFILPVLVIATFLASTGIGLIFASLNLKYRDVRYAMPFMIQVMMYATPVIYPSSLLSEKFEWVLKLNPMTGIIETGRAAILNTKPIDWDGLLIAIVISTALFLIGVWRFRKTEQFFADVI